MAEKNGNGTESTAGSETKKDSTTESKTRADGPNLAALLDRIEKRTNDLAEEVKRQMPEAKAKLRENILVTVLCALGLGFILGILFMGGRRGR